MVSGIFHGSLYGLVAVGLSLVFGVAKFLNVAHGSLIMLGGYASVLLFSHLHIDPFLGIPLAAAVLFLFGAGLYLGFFSRIIKYHEEAKINTSLLIAFGLIMIIDNTASWAWTGNIRGMAFSYKGEGAEILGLHFPYTELGFIALSGLVILALHLFLRWTYFGKSIRATAEDWEAASLMGININRTYLITFALGAALAAMAGTVIATSFAIHPHIGLEWTLKALIVLVLAGMGSIGGAFVAGLMLGVVEALGGIWIPEYTPVIGLVLFLLVLMLRPQGLFGKKLAGA